MLAYNSNLLTGPAAARLARRPRRRARCSTCPTRSSCSCREPPPPRPPRPQPPRGARTGSRGSCSGGARRRPRTRRAAAARHTCWRLRAPPRCLPWASRAPGSWSCLTPPATWRYSAGGSPAPQPLSPQTGLRRGVGAAKPAITLGSSPSTAPTPVCVPAAADKAHRHLPEPHRAHARAPRPVPHPGARPASDGQDAVRGGPRLGRPRHLPLPGRHQPAGHQLPADGGRAGGAAGVCGARRAAKGVLCSAVQVRRGGMSPAPWLCCPAALACRGAATARIERGGPPPARTGCRRSACTKGSRQTCRRWPPPLLPRPVRLRRPRAAASCTSRSASCQSPVGPNRGSSEDLESTGAGPATRAPSVSGYAPGKARAPTGPAPPRPPPFPRPGRELFPRRGARLGGRGAAGPAAPPPLRRRRGGPLQLQELPGGQPAGLPPVCGVHSLCEVGFATSLTVGGAASLCLSLSLSLCWRKA